MYLGVFQPSTVVRVDLVKQDARALLVRELVGHRHAGAALQITCSCSLSQSGRNGGRKREKISTPLPALHPATPPAAANERRPQIGAAWTGTVKCQRIVVAENGSHPPGANETTPKQRPIFLVLRALAEQAGPPATTSSIFYLAVGAHTQATLAPWTLPHDLRARTVVASPTVGRNRPRESRERRNGERSRFDLETESVNELAVS